MSADFTPMDVSDELIVQAVNLLADVSALRTGASAGHGLHETSLETVRSDGAAAVCLILDAVRVAHEDEAGDVSEADRTNMWADILGAALAMSSWEHHCALDDTRLEQLAERMLGRFVATAHGLRRQT